MTMRQYKWIDHQSKRIFTTDSETCPPGCAVFTGAMPSGYTMNVGYMFMDAAPEGAGVTFFDTAGPTPLLDSGDFLSDALAVCPRNTQDLQFKAARAMIDAERATSDAAFGNAVSAVQSMAGSYAARAFTTKDAAEKVALTKAAQALSGFSAALQVNRTGKPVALADAWKGERA